MASERERKEICNKNSWSQISGRGWVKARFEIFICDGWRAIAIGDRESPSATQKSCGRHLRLWRAIDILKLALEASKPQQRVWIATRDHLSLFLFNRRGPTQNWTIRCSDSVAQMARYQKRSARPQLESIAILSLEADVDSRVIHLDVDDMHEGVNRLDEDQSRSQVQWIQHDSWTGSRRRLSTFLFLTVVIVRTYFSYFSYFSW
jgi:hypothetical protein